MSSAYTESLNKLIEEFGRLPGVGPKTAERLAFHILKADAPEAMKLAAALVAKSPLAMRYCKAAVGAAAGTDLVTGLGVERDLFALAFATEDQTEGMTAFLEKRTPEFRGR